MVFIHRKKKLVIPCLFQESDDLYSEDYAQKIINWLIDLAGQNYGPEHRVEDDDFLKRSGKSISNFFHSITESVDSMILPRSVIFRQVERGYKFNTVTNIWEPVRIKSDSETEDLEMLVISRDLDPSSRPNKASFEHSFDISRQLYDNSAWFAEPIAYISDCPRDEQNLKQEIAKNPELRELVESNFESLEDFIEALEETKPKEALVVKRLNHERLDRAFIYICNRMSELDNKVRDIRSRKSCNPDRPLTKRNMRRSDLHTLTHKIYGRILDYNILRHLKTVVENIYIGTNKCKLPEPEIPVGAEYWRNELSKNLQRLEKAELKKHDSLKHIDTSELADHKRHKNHIGQEYFNHLFSIIDQYGLVGFSHGEAVPHHFAVDKNNDIRGFDLDKATKRGFIFYDLVTTINNVVLDTTFDQRQEMFTKCLLHFAQLQLTEGVTDGLVKIVADDQGIRKLKHFDISRDDSRGYDEFIDQQQLSDYLDAFNLFSAVYYPMLAGRASKFELEDTEAYDELMRSEIWGVSKNLPWFSEYLREKKDYIEQEIKYFNRKHSTMQSINTKVLLNMLETPRKITLMDRYSAEFVRSKCADRMYETLEHLETKFGFNCPEDFEPKDSWSQEELQARLEKHKKMSAPLNAVKYLKSYMLGLTAARTHCGNKYVLPVSPFHEKTRHNET